MDDEFFDLLRRNVAGLVQRFWDAGYHRRVTRAKQTTQEWRDMVDQIPEDRSIQRATDADYRYIGIDTTGLDVTETLQRIKSAIPEVYGR